MIYYLCLFLYQTQLISWKPVKHSIYHLCNKNVLDQNNFLFRITQDMDFYFNIVTVINFLTSLTNAIIISICYKKCKDLLAGILTVTMDTLQQNQQVQALRFSDDELSTVTVETTTVDSNNTDYFQFTITWIVLIVFLSILFTTCIILDNCTTYCTT